MRARNVGSVILLALPLTACVGDDPVSSGVVPAPEGGTPAGTTSDGGSTPSDASALADGGGAASCEAKLPDPDGRAFRCGATECLVINDYACCDASDERPGAGVCVAKTHGRCVERSLRVECTSSSNCSAANVCCAAQFLPTTPTECGNAWLFSKSRCAPSCADTEVQLCEDKVRKCPAGKSCTAVHLNRGAADLSYDVGACL